MKYLLIPFLLSFSIVYKTKADFFCTDVLVKTKHKALLEELGKETSSDFFHFTRQSYKRVQYLLEQYPPHQYFLVGWGVNNAVEAAILKIILGDQFESYFMQVPVVLNRLTFPDLGQAEKSNLFSHFTPQSHIVKDRQIVIIRNLFMTGQASVVIGEMINSLFQSIKKQSLLFDLTWGGNVPEPGIQNYTLEKLSQSIFYETSVVYASGVENKFQEAEAGQGPILTRSSKFRAYTKIVMKNKEFTNDAVKLYYLLQRYTVFKVFHSDQAIDPNFEPSLNEDFNVLVELVHDILKISPNSFKFSNTD